MILPLVTGVCLNGGERHQAVATKTSNEPNGFRCQRKNPPIVGGLVWAYSTKKGRSEVDRPVPAPFYRHLTKSHNTYLLAPSQSERRRYCNACVCWPGAAGRLGMVETEGTLRLRHASWECTDTTQRAHGEANEYACTANATKPTCAATKFGSASEPSGADKRIDLTIKRKGGTRALRASLKFLQHSRL